MTSAQTVGYPKELRGYKVERAVVEVKKDPNRSQTKGIGQPAGGTYNEDDLIRFGDPQLASLTPLGISLEIPIVISPVTEKGKVDFLVFEDIVVNGTSVEIDEYHRAFTLPNEAPLTLREPLRFYVYLPSAVLAALDEWSNSRDSWQVTGRVYVFGKFRKSIFNFKRCIPVELRMTIRNPLHK